ncbi:MAG: hypothetical protein PGN13_16390 [Patulibacter minatonensis]
MIAPLSSLAPLGWSTDRLVAAVDLVGLGATLGGVGAAIGPVLLYLTSRRSSNASSAATEAAVGRRVLADEMATQVRVLTSQVEMQQRLVMACPVNHCPVRRTMTGARQ